MAKQEDKQVIGVCGECKTDQSTSYLEKNPFAQQGSPVPCQICGGVVVFCYREDRGNVLTSVDRQRNIGRGHISPRE